MAEVIDLEEVKSYAATLLAAADGQKLDGAGLGAKLSKKFDSSGLVKMLVSCGYLCTDGTGPGNHDYYLPTGGPSMVHRPAPKTFRKSPPSEKAVASSSPSTDISSVLVKGFQAQIDEQKRMIESLVQRIAALEGLTPSSGRALADT
jgi:hypothetical protein